MCVCDYHVCLFDTLLKVCVCVCVQIMFLELRLPPNGDVTGLKNTRTLGYARSGAGKVRLGKQFSTTKVTHSLTHTHSQPCNNMQLGTEGFIGRLPDVIRTFLRSSAPCTRSLG